MGASVSQQQRQLLPGRPGQFKEGSRVKVWYVGEDPGAPYTGRTGEVAAVMAGGTHYDIKTDRDELMRNVPYYVLSYPNETRSWHDYFKEGQRARLNNRVPCVILNVEMDDRKRTRVSLRDLDTGHIHMNVNPTQVSFDHNLF
jgi:hypothetical protein